MKCKKCRGTGFINLGDCSECSGTGSLATNANVPVDSHPVLEALYKNSKELREITNPCGEIPLSAGRLKPKKHRKGSAGATKGSLARRPSTSDKIYVVDPNTGYVEVCSVIGIVEDNKSKCFLYTLMTSSGAHHGIIRHDEFEFNHDLGRWELT